jgi:hypothetical protein
MRKTLLLLPLALLSAGCVRTAASIVTAPFKVVSQAADWATTSQDEADRNYGRKMRDKEAREGKERRAFEKRCRDNREGDGCGEYAGYRAGVDDR